MTFTALERRSGKTPLPACARLVLAGLATVLITACGARIEGTYTGENTFLESITLASGGKVNVQFMGMTRQGTYDIDGRELTISVGNDVQVLQIDKQGCLVGGGFLGTYCKSGEAPRAGKEREETRLAGAYLAGDERSNIRLEFGRNGQVRLTMREGGSTSDSAEGNYEVNGNRVNITVPGGESLELVRSGDTLEGNVGFATFRFVKQ